MNFKQNIAGVTFWRVRCGSFWMSLCMLVWKCGHPDRHRGDIST